jgi:ABC-type molybdate transport system substrate-binding protein
MRQALAGVLVLLFLGLRAGGAGAAEIKVLSTGNMSSILAEITGEFERTTGHKLAIAPYSAA